jgi:rare lipoprotein A (peptidoglycan hydrolase)
LATGAAVLATLVAGGLALQPEPAPEPVPLGKGKAGVVALADTAAVTPAPAPEAPAETDAEGTPIAGGEASYYGEELAGNPTASGELFEPGKLTAAHRSLPLGSRVRVTNVSNGESVVVRVNDRGPFAKNRVIDVSKAAAREIGLLRRGTGQVRLELVPTRG